MVRTICVVMLVAMISGVALAQQTTGDILGTVTDTSGATIANVAVAVENVGTHESRSTRTSDKGDYVINLLNPGQYSVKISADGFKTFVAPAFPLSAGDRIRVDARLSVGQVAETVTVEARTPILQTDSSVLSTTVDERQTQDLPLNGRNFMQLVQLVPGANEGPPDSLTNGSKLDDRRQSAAVSVNGQSDVLNNQMIDGADNNERLIGTLAVRPSVESIGEVRVQTNDYTAEVGRTGGGIINVITKSGTDDFHGSLFEYFRNDILDATNYDFGQKLPKAELRLNQFGASAGGPIVKDRTFFFGDYEGYRSVAGLPPVTTRVPTAAERLGDFSADPSQAPNFGPPSPDSAGVDYLNLWPLPNKTDPTGALNLFVGVPKLSQNSHDFDLRVDHEFDAHNLVFARFIYNNVYTDGPGPLPPARVAGLTINPSSIFTGLASYAKDTDYNGLLNYVHLFNNNLLLELKAGYTRANNQSFPVTDGQNPNTAFGQPNVNTPISDSTGLAPILVTTTGATLGSVFFQPVKDQDNTFQYLGSLTYTRGAHNLKFGGSVIRRQLTSFQSSFQEGFYIFLTFGDLYNGQYIQSNRSLQLVVPHLRVWEPSAYAQDDWRVNKRLTLNLGLRYDLYTPFTEVANHISTFDPAAGQLLVAGQNGVPNTAGIKTDYHGLSPRVGFAATVANDLVVRGGFGISYVPMNGTSNANLKNPPFVNAISCNFFTCGTLINGYPAPVPTNIDDPGNNTIPDAVDPNWRTSYFEQFNLTVQKDWSGNVATVSYVGLLGRRLAQLLPDLNGPGPNTCLVTNPNNQSAQVACENQLRPYYSIHPNLTTVGFFETHGKSSFNALQGAYQRRFKNGLGVNANYQWAHNLDNATGLSEEGAGGYGQSPSQVSALEYGNSALDTRQRIAVTANYQLPFGKTSTGAKGALVKGWQANLIFVRTSGIPFTVLNNSTVSNAVPGSADRPNVVGDPNVSNPSISEFFNTAAFGPQTAGTIGNEQRNLLHGPPFRHADLSLFKIFPIRERHSLEFRAECFNLSNTVNFGTPNASVGQPLFGSITSTSFNYTPRQFQFALKFRY